MRFEAACADFGELGIFMRLSDMEKSRRMGKITEQEHVVHADGQTLVGNDVLPQAFGARRSLDKSDHVRRNKRTFACLIE